MGNVEQKPSLLDVGTRFKHYADLLDYFSDGVEANKQSYKRSPNPVCQLRLAQLEAAVLLLKKHVELLSDYDRHQWKMREEIERIPRNKWTDDPTS